MKILYAIKNDFNVNWAQLIMIHMMYYITKSKFLPYAWFITRIMEHVKIVFDGFQYGLMDTNAHKITIKNINKMMGVFYNPETKAISYISGDLVENEDNEHGVEGGEYVHPPPIQNGPSNQAMYDLMTTQFSNLNTTMNNQWTSAH